MQLTSESIDLIATTLLQTLALQVLDLSHNPFTQEDTQILSLAMQANQTLKVLCLQNCNIKQAIHIAGILSKNRTLCVLDVSGNAIGPEGAEIFAECLRINSSLKIMNVADESMGCSGVLKLLSALILDEKCEPLELQLYLDRSLRQRYTFVNYQKFIRYSPMHIYSTFKNGIVIIKDDIILLYKYIIASQQSVPVGLQ